MTCTDCLAAYRPAPTPASPSPREATYRVFLTGFSSAKPVLLCADHAIARYDVGEVGRAVRILGSAK